MLKDLIKRREYMRKYSREWYHRSENHDRLKRKARDYRKEHRLRLLILNKKWRDSRKNKSENARLRYIYGIGLADLSTMKKTQKGLCAVCGLKKPLVIDHDHESGKVRGLCCRNCNSGMGLLKDSISMLKRAIKYLEANR